MLLLCDWSLEIPAFLHRNADGAFKNPNVKYLPPASSTGATLAPSSKVKLDKWGLPVNEQDERVKRLIELDEKREITDQKVAGDKARRVAKASERARLLASNLKQRKVFIKHFKWDFKSEEGK